MTSGNDSFWWFWNRSIHKNIQLMLEFLKALFLVLHFFCYKLMTFLKILSVILLSMLMILLSTLKCNQTSGLLEQLEWASKLESDLQDTVDWGRKWFVDFNTGKHDWFCLTDLKTPVLLMWKWMRLFMRKNYLLRCISWPSSKFDWVLTLSQLLKLPPRNFEPWFVILSFFLLRLLSN